ncbi:TlpA family protein disulfide reductase [Paenibacillus sanguinis]|uniref:TlpA family protein disulfide reductase n=1 Tax=Paenibacillus sanguinis TaxID=225906 RepID=UPI000365A799|nr:TlpA disulfide reductase family protein [Paenibacillus sanguinis]
MKRNRWIWAALLILLGVAIMDRGVQEGWWNGFGERDSSTTEGKDSSLAAMAAAEGTPKPGAAVPSFSLSGMDGNEYKVGGKRDKVLLLNFWASWCGPCKDEAPDLVALAGKYKDSLDIYAVNVTQYDNLEDAEKFVKDYGLTFPVLMDRGEEVFQGFGGRAFPTNVLVDREGIIRDVILGTLPSKDLEAKLKQIMES